MLNSKLQQLKEHFGIATVHDWQAVRPEWIISLNGIGPKTLEYLRLMLAQHDVTLKDDRTPEFWRANRGSARIVEVLGNEQIDDDDGSPAAKDRGMICPFTVLIDTAEQSPFSFQNLRADAVDGGRPLIVPVRHQSLGRHPDSLGDYSLDSPLGGQGRCHIERKSMADAHSTFLGWARKGEDTGRRERFERELELLSEMEAGLVLVECSFTQLIAAAPQYGVRTAAQNAKALHRSVLSWMRRYRVQWIFTDDRRVAERTAFHWLRQWYEAGMELRKQETREAKQRRAAKQQPLPIAAAQPTPQAFDLSTV